jgi:peptide/nickel transport system substrate-binding protein
MTSLGQRARIACAVICIGVASIGVSACGGSSTGGGDGSSASSTSTVSSDGGGQSAKGGTLVVAVAQDMGTTDPVLSDDIQVPYVATQVMQGLMELPYGKVATPVPVLAKAQPAVTNGGKVYTFSLRQGVKFQDGTPFNAAAVKYNFERWISLPKSLQSYALYVGTTIGFGSSSVIKSIDVLGTYKIRFVLKRPVSAFLDYLSLPYLFISSPTALKAGGADNSITNFSKISYAQGGKDAMVGTGPYKFSSWTRGSQIVLTKNPDYWNKTQAARTDRIVMDVVTDPQALLNGIESGQYDIAEQVEPSQLASLQGNSNVQIVKRAQSIDQFELDINQAVKPLDNRAVRLAMAYAINKPAIIKTFYAGLATPAAGFVPRSYEYFKNEHLPPYDPAKAKQLLAQSGVGGKDLDIDLWYPSDVSRPYMPDPANEVQQIAADLNAVGFHITLRTAPWSPTYLDDYYKGQYGLYLLGTNGQWPSADNFLISNYFGYVNGKPAPNYNWADPQLQNTMQKALAAPNTATASKLWGKAQDIIRQDMPIVPILNAEPPAALKTGVKGYAAVGNLQEQLWNVTVP